MSIISRILFINIAIKVANRDTYSTSLIRVNSNIVFNIADNIYAVIVVGGLLYSTI